jgi:D-arabinose 1-dehydrogenase-like Zn-dependent alcohol dehydrogenase
VTRRLQPNQCSRCRGVILVELVGYAEYAVADQRFCFPIPGPYSDAEELFTLAPRVPVRTTVQTFPLSEANETLSRLRSGKIQGAAVLVPGG